MLIFDWGDGTMKKIFIDAGHGGTDGGASANGLVEKNLTLDLALRTRALLNELYSGHEVRMSRTTDVGLTLLQRTNAANQWGADFLVSIHINAGGGTGFESFIYNGSFSGKPATNTMRGKVHDAIVSQTGFNDRGKKEANFHMVRESNMPACLTENGFIDRVADANLLKSSAFLDQIARGHAVGIANALSLPPKDSSGGGTLYRVVTGSFTNRQHADEQIAALQAKGFDSFILPFTSGGTTYYRVITGSFAQRANAEARVAALSAAGFESFIITS